MPVVSSAMLVASNAHGSASTWRKCRPPRLENHVPRGVVGPFDVYFTQDFQRQGIEVGGTDA